jgi:hypothetical protein
MQLPATQTSKLLHDLPQRPHDPPSFCRSTHPRLAQEVSPARQTHAEPLHCCREEQLAPQAPHCFGSSTRSRHAPLHAVEPLGHAHALAEQVANVGHEAPHAPQSAGFVLVSTQTPPQ